MTKGVTSEGVTSKALPDGLEAHTCPDCGVTITGPGYPKLHTCRKDLPANFGQIDCECRHCQNNRAAGSKHRINHGPYKPAGELADNELNRVVLPSDMDYEASKENINGPNEFCSACSIALPQLERPRQHPGKCLACATKEPIVCV